MPLRMIAADKQKGRSFRNTRRENRLEELGRVDAEKAHTSKGKRNLREEKDRIRSELAVGGIAREAGRRLKAKAQSGPQGKGRRKKHVFDSSAARKKDLKQQAYRAKVEELGGKVKFAGEWKAKGKKAGPSAPRRKYFKNKTHGGGPDSGNIGRLKDTLSKYADANKGLGKKVPRKPDLSRLKEKMPKYMQPLRKGGSTKKPRPHGPHMWVRGDTRKKYAAGKVVKGAISGAKKVGKGLGKGLGKIGKGLLSGAKKITRQKYSSGGAVMAGKKVGCQIK